MAGGRGADRGWRERVGSWRAALGWAVRQARLTEAAVEALSAWEYPVTYGYHAPVLAATDFG